MKLSMKTILFIDDGKIDSQLKHFSGLGYICEQRGFEEIEKTLDKVKPEIIILDYKKEQQTSGIAWFNRILEKDFAPIIFYTAFFEELEEQLKSTGYINHPLIFLVKKGPTDIKELTQFVTDSEKIIDNIKSLEEEFFQEFKESKHETLKTTISFFEKQEFLQDPTRVRRIILRKFANKIEKSIIEPIEPYEIYIFPPADKGLLVGDVIKDTQSNDYYVILTPSCDMVEGRNDSQVHICKIEDCDQIIKICGLSDTKNSKKREDLIDRIQTIILNSGFKGKIFPIPPLPGYFSSTKAINLKDCIYVEFVQIESDQTRKSKKRFVRIASLDNPFRETLVWAFMSLHCRPGLPKRNLEKWAGSILDNC
jgi:hypothetical protein